MFAAARAAGAPLLRYALLRDWLLEHWARVAAIALTRTTQTNEAARCAVLLPALAAIDGPVALIEVGASAGLCLYPDRYSYRYRTPEGVRAVDPPAGASAVVIECAIDDVGLVPAAVPDVVWRAGIDLNPLDVRSPEDVAWLRTLIWPEHAHRRQRLDAAVALAATDPPRLVRGDLVEELGLDGTWLANEAPGVLAATSHLPHDGRFVLSVDGAPVARTHPHGERYSSL